MSLESTTNSVKRSLARYHNLYKVIKTLYQPVKKLILFPADLRLSIQAIQTVKSAFLNPSPKIIYCGVPRHPNLGDLAQSYCILQWLQQNYADFQVIALPTAPFLSNRFDILDFIKTHLNSRDFFVFQSGYCITNNHPDEKMHRAVIRKFPDSRIVIFPQTVDVTGKEREKTAKIYATNPHVFFMARDCVSYDMATLLFPNAKVVLFPDIVTSLIGRKAFPKPSGGILFCMRNDLESLHTRTQVLEAVQKAKTVCRPVHLTDTTLTEKTSYIKQNFQRIFQETLTLFSEHEAVVTDRFHGVVFSLIAGRPVIVVPSQGHKVVAGAEWMKQIYPGYVFLADTLEEVPRLIRTALAIEKSAPPLDNYFNRQYYQKLYHLIEDERREHGSNQYDL